METLSTIEIVKDPLSYGDGSDFLRKKLRLISLEKERNQLGVAIFYVQLYSSFCHTTSTLHMFIGGCKIWIFTSSNY